MKAVWYSLQAGVPGVALLQLNCSGTRVDVPCDRQVTVWLQSCKQQAMQADAPRGMQQLHAGTRCHNSLLGFFVCVNVHVVDDYNMSGVLELG